MSCKADVRDVRVTGDFSTENADLCRDALLAFCDSPLFHDDEHRYEAAFYGRRLRPHILKHLDFSKPLDVSRLGSYAALSANRALAAMNETEFLLLPTEGSLHRPSFEDFYADHRRAAAALAAPFLERFLFDCLRREILVSDNWSLVRVRDYFLDFAETSRRGERLPSADAILASRDPATAAKDWLLQLAPDFLLESSPMARYAGGSYGEIGSTLFKIIIDELGYGEHARKHATLFERTLVSAGLDPTPHRYFQYYLNGSLLLANYYNMITRNKRNVFRYIGAIYLAETGFITSCRIWREALARALPGLDVRYFDEHCHIDTDHSRMAFDGLVAPAIERYGAFAAGEIVRGFEEARWLGEYAERDFVAQTRWKDEAEANRQLHDRIFPRVAAAFERGEIKRDRLHEPKGELSVTHSHDGDEVCHIVSGTMEFLNGFGTSSILSAGEGIVIRRERLHGALIQSAHCDYEIYSVGDVERWL